MSIIFLQIFVLICFLSLIIVLFFDKLDYLLYSILFIIIASIVSGIFLEEARTLEFYILQIKWDVIIFIIGLFIIVEVLNEAQFFEDIADYIIARYQNKPTKLFYIFCLLSTLLASFVAAISITIILVPIIIKSSRKIGINPAPYLFGLSVCVNLAATLTPFGSAQNILISNEFNLDFLWFLVNIIPYFIITIMITLILLQLYVLNPNLKKKKMVENSKEENRKKKVEEGIDGKKVKKSGIGKEFIKNLVALIVLIILLVFIEAYYIVTIAGAIVFVFLNPVNKQKKLRSFSLYHYLNRIDYKLIYFFICLFIFVGLLQLNGTILMVEKWIENISYENEFILAIIILIITSILSGLLDNAPVTVIFIPIIKILLALPVFYSGPILIAFILGINLGGNFLPQGSAADMMTLELAKYNNVNEVNYKSMFKIGAFFSILHVIIGIGYLFVIIYIL